MFDDLLIDFLVHYVVLLLLSIAIAYLSSLCLVFIVYHLHSSVLFFVTYPSKFLTLIILECLVNLELRSRAGCIIVKCLTMVLVEHHHRRTAFLLHLLHHLLHAHCLLHLELILEIHLLVISVEDAMQLLYIILGSATGMHVLLPLMLVVGSMFTLGRDCLVGLVNMLLIP